MTHVTKVGDLAHDVERACATIAATLWACAPANRTVLAGLLAQLVRHQMAELQHQAAQTETTVH